MTVCKQFLSATLIGLATNHQRGLRPPPPLILEKETKCVNFLKT